MRGSSSIVLAGAAAARFLFCLDKGNLIYDVEYNSTELHCGYNVQTIIIQVRNQWGGFTFGKFTPMLFNGVRKKKRS